MSKLTFGGSDDYRPSTYFAQQRTLSVLHRRHGLEPSHFVFLMRHLSHAFRTRLRYFALDSGEGGDWDEMSLALGFAFDGDMITNG